MDGFMRLPEEGGDEKAGSKRKWNVVRAMPSLPDYGANTNLKPEAVDSTRP